MASVEGLSINLATVRAQWDMRQAVEGCLRHGISAVAPWRDQVAVLGLDAATRLVRDAGVRITGLCRGGFFPAPTAAERARAVDDNKRAVDEAAALGADCLVIVAGGLPAGSKDLGAARAMVRDGLAAMLPHARAAGVPVAIEPLHPIYAADRCCVSTLKQALDLADELGEGVGAAIDVYHVWWDPELEAQLDAGGRGGADPRPPHLRLAGADPRPAERPRYDGRWRNRPRGDPTMVRDGGLRRAAGGRRSSRRRTGGSGAATRCSRRVWSASGRSAGRGCSCGPSRLARKDSSLPKERPGLSLGEGVGQIRKMPRFARTALRPSAIAHLVPAVAEQRQDDDQAVEELDVEAAEARRRRCRSG